MKAHGGYLWPRAKVISIYSFKLELFKMIKVALQSCSKGLRGEGQGICQAEYRPVLCRFASTGTFQGGGSLSKGCLSLPFNGALLAVNPQMPDEGNKLSMITPKCLPGCVA